MIQQQSKKRKNQGSKPVKVMVFLFFALFLLSNCQIKKTLTASFLNQSSTGHTPGKIDKGLPVSTNVVEDEPCQFSKRSVYSDLDIHTASVSSPLPSSELVLLSYLHLSLLFTGFSGDVHSPLVHLFEVLPAEGGNPIYIMNQYFLI